MATDPGLERLQRWMQSCILKQGAADAAMAADAGELVLPSKSLAPIERLDIYREMYLLRMEEALAIDYPALKHFLGDGGFMKLTARYVDVHPSRSYTLNRLGDGLPEFVASLDDLPNLKFCADLARLEYELSKVFDAPETKSLGVAEVRAVPQDAWEFARLQPIEAFRVLAFDYPVSQYLGAIDEENPFPRIAARKTWVAAYRTNYNLRRMDLTEPAFELLRALASGRTLGEGIAALLGRKWRPAVKEAQLFEWFRDWMAAGLFRSVELPCSQPTAPVR